MKLHSPTFEKQLRHQIRHAIRASPALQKEYRVAKKTRRHYQGWLILRPIISVLFAAVVWHVQESTGHFATALALTGLWCFMFIFVQAQRLLTCLYGSADLPCLSCLPVDRELVFRWELQKVFKGALWFALDLIAALVALGLSQSFSTLQWAGILPFGAIAWLNVLALAILFAAHRPLFPFQMVSTACMGLVFAVFVGRDLIGKPLLALLDRFAPSLNLLLPTAWPLATFGALVSGGDLIFWLLLIPVLGICGAVRPSIARIRAQYDFQDTVLPEAPDLIPEAATADSVAQGGTRVGITTIEEMILSRSFLTRTSWSDRGWAEARLWHWLTPREHGLADFAFPDGPTITRPWKTIFRNLLVAALLSFGAGLLGPMALWWVLGIGLFVIASHALSQTYTVGQTFQQSFSSGVNIPVYAGFPVGFSELSRLLFKVTLAQAPFLSAFTAASTLLVFRLLDRPLSDGALFGLKLALLLLAGRFFSVVLSFSSGTNDTSRVRLKSLWFLLPLLTTAFGFAGLSAAALFVRDQLVAWAALALALLAAYAFFWIYSRFYNSKRFDLISLPKQQ